MSPADFAAFGAFRASRRREHEFVSHVLHDEIGQVLTAAALELDLIVLDHGAAQPELAAAVASVQKTLEHAFAKVRALSHQVHPDPVARFGFRPVIDRLVTDARARFAGELVLHVEGAGAPPEPVGTALYECASEAVENAIRHARATRIDIALTQGDVTRITVSDNGSGFELEKVEPGAGLFTFRYYQGLGMLYLKLESERGRGTSVTLTARNGDT